MVSSAARPHPTLVALYVAALLLCARKTAAVRGRGGSGGGGLGMANQFLGPQNAARTALGLPPLVWDARLARYAGWYAAKRRRDCALVHSTGQYGENIFWGSGAGWTPGQAVAAWLSEGQWYHRGANSCAQGKVCGHYTQIVWSNSRKLGCAMVLCDGRRGTFITCNYDPPGNYIGERPY